MIQELFSLLEKASVPPSYILFILAYFQHLTEEEKEAILIK